MKENYWFFGKRSDLSRAVGLMCHGIELHGEGIVSQIDQ